DNPPERCYLCKQHIFSAILDEAKKEGFQHVVDGTNIDDYQDIRPGIRALRELGVRSPLADAGITKEEIRQYSKEMNLPTWNKPAYACLLSRIPFHTRIRQELLDRIEQAERLVRGAGFPAARVRTHEDIARIEVPPGQLKDFLEKASEEKLIRRMKELGYRYVTLDLEGYRMGSFNDPETKQ
ncbi:MAG TPA: ATP-dependent sacrificial sulfur transferase LarE, partial [Bacteroidales bacterium]|nr:ATP-dependent sacrificial sulfur transferase LarE [Bacteroidales bacterium]